MSEIVRLPALLWVGRGVGVRMGLAILALGTVGVFSATATWAADDDKAAASAGDTGGSNVDEIVVTARKRSENLRDIPASITATRCRLLRQ